MPLQPISHQFQQPNNPNYYQQAPQPLLTPSSSARQKVKFIEKHLKENPLAFNLQERLQCERYTKFITTSYFEAGLYLLVLFAGRNYDQTREKVQGTIIFKASRQRLVYTRFFLLNLAMATNIMASYRDQKFKVQMADKFLIPHILAQPPITTAL